MSRFLAPALLLGAWAAFPAALAAKRPASALDGVPVELADAGGSPGQPRVVIVGAGIAGLATAYELKTRHGIDSEVYEAKDRVGGRTWSVPGPPGTGLYTELGGSFINSTDEALLDLIQRLGLTVLKLSEKDDTKYLFQGENGRQSAVDTDSFFQEHAEIFQRIHEDQQRLGIRDGKLPSGAGQAARRFDGLSVDAYLERIGAPWMFREFVSAFYGMEDGRRLGEVSALHLLTELSIDAPAGKFSLSLRGDEAWTLQGGNQRIALEIESRLGNVRKNHVLKSIESRDRKSFRLVFETPNGTKTVSADYVVITIPFPALKENVRLDVRGFPDKVRESIGNANQGRNSKMILYFHKPVWRTGYNHSGTVQTSRFQTWDSDYGQNSSYGVLTVYFHDHQDFSRADQLRAEVLELLETAYPGLSGEYMDMTIADWPGDRFSRGSYSGTLSPGRWSQGYPRVSDMRVGNLLFAGEHLSGSRDKTGYMNGAADSALQAVRILAPMIGASRPRRRAGELWPDLKGASLRIGEALAPAASLAQ